MFQDFHSTKQGLPSVDSWSHRLDQNQSFSLAKIKCIPIVIRLSNCTPLGLHYIT